MSQPTQETYGELERAFDFFNDELFQGRLPRCLISLQRQNESYGYFSRDRFTQRNGSGEKTHEIALNPSYFAIHPIEMTLSVLVREMVSLDQTINGEPGRRRYRNKEWGDMLELIGLMPSDTGEPGGKRSGENVQHYIIEGGLFDIACTKLCDETFTLTWVDRFPPVYGNDPSLLGDDGKHEPAAHAQGPKPDAGTGLDLGLIDGDDDLESLDLSGGESGAPISLEQLDGLIELDAAEQPDHAGATHDSPKGKQPAASPPMKRFEIVDAASLIERGFEVQEAKKPQSREKYSCPSCNNKVWGKPGMQVGCFDCDDKPLMVAEGKAYKVKHVDSTLNVADDDSSASNDSTESEKSTDIQNEEVA